MHAQRPQDSVVRVSASDFRLIVQSNEVGKKAQARALILQAKVDTLQNIVRGQATRLQLKDSTIDDRTKQVQALQLVHSNDAQIIKNKDVEIGIWKRETKVQKRKKWAAIVLGVITTSFSTYQWLK